MILEEHQEIDEGKGIIWTNAARCRDCNRCVKSCLVKAIRKEGHQAKVLSNRCILCGICIRECPQGAKAYLDSTNEVISMLQSGAQVAVSLAPSYLAAFSSAEIRGLPGVLRQLGFSLVTETSVGAELSAQAARAIIEANPHKQYIYAACPAMVGYVYQKWPELVPALLPVASPMIAHGRYLKSTYGKNLKVVFIGPCVAKKEEAANEVENPSIDAALTFEELKKWMLRQKLNPLLAEESGLNDALSLTAATFPLSGGFAKTAWLSTDSFNRLIVNASGPEELRDAMEYAAGSQQPLVLEGLMCPGGCLDGVGMGERTNPLALRRAFLNTIEDVAVYPALRAPLQAEKSTLDLSIKFNRAPAEVISFSENQIREVLLKIGKREPTDELNCGACGYNTCREKALAFLAGMAEIEMCLPYMRHHSETITDAIIHNSPSAIVILDSELKIVHTNPKFQEMFMSSDYCNGRHISYFINPEPFQQVLRGEPELYNQSVHHHTYGLFCQQLIYKIGAEDRVQLVGILVDLTRSKQQETELDLLQKETLKRAEQVVERQFETAREVTRLQGQAAAEISSILASLTDLVTRKGEG
ncbi:MAG TPA: [Fe-Fe] hydrogenase large subunit C-terminal domain-containing protein [Candidatus Limnocylindrales bacterium]|nr:[Fe-Fe] hydrogenase large subunit C-terminal domain-containing protein [Candidatus Limnocylindrales bacterium]